MLAQQQEDAAKEGKREMIYNAGAAPLGRGGAPAAARGGAGLPAQRAQKAAVEHVLPCSVPAALPQRRCRTSWRT